MFGTIPDPSGCALLDEFSFQFLSKRKKNQKAISNTIIFVWICTIQAPLL